MLKNSDNFLDLSVVIPVLDEQDNIVDLVDETSAVLHKQAISYEIIVVDDGSRDETVQRLLAHRHESDIPLRVIRHQHNAGQSSAVFTGIMNARSAWIATMDGDGQNDPADIPELFQVATSAEDTLKLVCGQRRKRQDSALKRLSSKIANAVRSRLLNDQTPDTGCGLKLIDRATFLQLPFFDHMHRFLPALVLRTGAGVRSVEVTHRPRLKGESKYGLHNRLWVGIVDMLGVIWLQRRAKAPISEELE